MLRFWAQISLIFALVATIFSTCVLVLGKASTAPPLLLYTREYDNFRYFQSYLVDVWRGIDMPVSEVRNSWGCDIPALTSQKIGVLRAGERGPYSLRLHNYLFNTTRVLGVFRGYPGTFDWNEDSALLLIQESISNLTNYYVTDVNTQNLSLLAVFDGSSRAIGQVDETVWISWRQTLLTIDLVTGTATQTGVAFPNGARTLTNPDSLSFNGQWLVFTRNSEFPQRYPIYVFNTSTGNYEQIYSARGYVGFDWSPQTQYLAMYKRETETIQLYDTVSRRLTTLISNRPSRGMLWSPNGNYLFVQSDQQVEHLGWMFNVETKEVQNIQNPYLTNIEVIAWLDNNHLIVSMETLSSNNHMGDWFIYSLSNYSLQRISYHLAPPMPYCFG